VSRAGLAIVAACVAATGGCRDGARATRAARANRPRPALPEGAAEARAGATVAGNEPAPSSWSCGAVHDPSPVARRLGHGRRLVLGAIADTHGALPATLAEVERFAARFGERGVDAVAALGDLGASEDEIARVLAALRPAHAPILAIAGEREPENAFHAAVKRVQKDGIEIVDLVDKRRMDIGDIDIVSLPGYPVTRTGCRYRQADLEGVRALLAGRDRARPLVVLGHMPPRGSQAQAIDRGLGDANVGDGDVTALLEAIAPSLALFAHVDEAGGRAQAAGAGEWINVGAADAVPHELVGGGSAGAGAAIVEFSDGKARLERLP
jgi:Icc-related predicted phosphoesterase